MGIYKLYRQKPEAKAVRGQLYACQENLITGQTENATYVAATLENLDYLIPAGLYRVAVTLSPRFQTLMPLLLNVPHRSGIRIHWGSKPGHSQGCILLTHRAQYQALVKSLLNQQENLESITLEIIDNK